eukprot:m.479319 g.479319  ORF g.479319 m.479319 type:complete len:845 (-) comp21699_c0_seq1:208-2742(-)
MAGSKKARKDRDEEISTDRGQYKKIRKQLLKGTKLKSGKKSPARATSAASSDKQNPSNQSYFVHRCRFIEYMPTAINSIVPQVIPSQDKKDKSEERDIRVAVSRDNGNIEIWNVSNDWHMERIIPGSADASVEAVVWHGDRLFTAGLHSMIMEWNASTLKVEGMVDSYGGSVWCMDMNHAGTTLAAGCEDGCVKLVDVEHGTLSYIRSFDKQEGRVLSVSWHENDRVLVSGGSDGTIRLWNAASGRCTLRIIVQSSGSAGKRTGTETPGARGGVVLVWVVRVLPDMTIVSGDSHGRTQFWDGKFGTLLQSFTHHEADVLTLAVTPDNSTIYASGVDNKVAEFRQAVSSTDDGSAEQRTWVLSGRCRDHTHDVRALALTPDGKLVTGGLDTNMIVYNQDSFGHSGASHRKLPPFPHYPMIKVAAPARLVLSRGLTKLQVWRLGRSELSSPTAVAAETARQQQTSDGSTLAAHVHHRITATVSTQPRLLLTLETKFSEHIISTCISDDGSLVAYATLSGTRVFHLSAAASVPDSDTVASCHVRRIKGLSGKLAAAHNMAFTTNSNLLVTATTDETLEVISIAEKRKVATLPVPPSPDNTTPRLGPCLLSISTDGQWTAVSYDERVHVFNLDALTYCASTPRFASMPSALAFQPGSSTVVVVCANHQVFCVDAESMEPTPWSEAHSHNLPQQWLNRKEKVFGISFDAALDKPAAAVAGRSTKAYLFDHAAFCVVDFAQPPPSSDARLVEVGATMQDLHGRQRTTSARRHGKDKHTSSTNGDIATATNFKLVKKFQPLLYAGFTANAHAATVEDAGDVAESDMVVVERPWLAIMQNLPPPLYREKYGV